jgi:hypothetical protein
LNFSFSVSTCPPATAPGSDCQKNENKATERNLGMIQPDAGGLKFFRRAAEKEKAKGMQASPFE